MDKSPKRSPKPKQQKQSVKDANKGSIDEKELQSSSNQNNRKVIKGQAKQLN